jgi:beta-mannanase
MNIRNAISSNSLIKMYWSPNVPTDSAAPYWPGAQYVDVVGIDCYPLSSALSSTAFSDCYSEFYNTYSAPYNLPFAIGETAYAGQSGNEAWLEQLVGQNMCSYPNYVACSWFEYDKEADFRIVEGVDSVTLSETKALLLNNHGEGPEKCVPFPPDTCIWG